MQTRPDHYLEQQILTATRERLLLLTYDGILRFLARAQQGLQRRDYHEKHIGISRAQGLLCELRASLDFGIARELAHNLARIYSYLIESLARADLEDDAQRLQHVTGLVAELRAAWEEAHQSMHHPPDPATAGGGGAGQQERHSRG